MIYEEVALIPSRGGSKGVKRKNLQTVGMKSLLVRAIDSAKKSSIFSRIVVSSDDSESLEIAKECGVTPIERDYYASTDASTADDVVRNFISKFITGDEETRNIRLTYLQPTSPFRNSEHILKAAAIARNHKSQSCVSIKQVKERPQKMVEISDDYLVPFMPSDINQMSQNRQTLMPVFMPNGAIYIFPLQRFKELQTFPILESGYLQMDEYSSLDIDSEFDLEIARLMESKYA